jgi:hypothetical protein
MRSERKRYSSRDGASGFTNSAQDDCIAPRLGCHLITEPAAMAVGVVLSFAAAIPAPPLRHP